jgi:hypothetical protein
MWYPTIAELLTERVATRQVNSADFALSGLSSTDMSPERIQQVLLGIPTYEAIRRINPDAYKQIYDAFAGGIRRGSSVAELHAQMAPIISATLVDTLPHAPQSLLLDFARFATRTAATLNKESPSSCYLFFNPHKASSSAYLEMRGRHKSVASAEDDITDKVLQSFTGKVRLPREQDISASRRKVQAALVARHGDELAILDEDTVPPAKHSKYCSMIGDLYEQALKLPPNEATALLRYMFAKN